MTDKEKLTCPHCGARLLKWAPPDNSTWDDFQYACFNDECLYYQKGWDWMMKKFKVKASYRYRYDPQTGQTGPLAVWSDTAIRNLVIDEKKD